MLSQLNFDGLGVRADGSLGVQCGVSMTEPRLQLRESVLELTKSQQRTLQFVLKETKDKMQLNIVTFPVYP